MEIGDQMEPGRPALHVSDKAYWHAVWVIAIFVCAACVAAAYAVFRVLDRDKTADHLAVRQSILVGDGTPISYVSSGTVTILPATQSQLPSGTHVSIPGAPAPPRVLLAVQQSGTNPYRGITVYVTDVTTTSFVIRTDMVTRGTATSVDTGEETHTVSLYGTVSDITSPLNVSWLAIV